jgi:hypothetical protein
MSAKIIKSSDVARCPKMSLLPAHYRRNGTCRCDEREAAATAVAAAHNDLKRARKVLRAAKDWQAKT